MGSSQGNSRIRNHKSKSGSRDQELVRSVGKRVNPAVLLKGDQWAADEGCGFGAPAPINTSERCANGE